MCGFNYLNYFFKIYLTFQMCLLANIETKMCQTV